MGFLKRLPLAVYAFVWAGGAFAWATLFDVDLLTSTFAVLGAFGLIVVSMDSGKKLGGRRAATTAALAASLGPWTALFAPTVTTEAALVLSVSAAYFALYLRAQADVARSEGGVLRYLGLRAQRPR